jgi:hypothetical protein
LQGKEIGIPVNVLDDFELAGVYDLLSELLATQKAVDPTLPIQKSISKAQGKRGG